MASSVRARSGFFEDFVVLEENRRCLGTLGQLLPRRRAPMVEPRRHRKAVACESDGAFQAALERQSAVGGMRHAPARDGAGNGERAGQRAAIGHFAQAAPRERLDRAARGRATAAVDVAHGVGGSVVDQPEGIAAHTGHVGIEDGECGAGRDCRIDGRTAVTQHRGAGLARKRVRTGHHAVRRTCCRTAGVELDHDGLVTNTNT